MRPEPETVYDMLRCAREDLTEAHVAVRENHLLMIERTRLFSEACDVLSALLRDGSVVAAAPPELLARAEALVKDHVPNDVPNGDQT